MTTGVVEEGQGIGQGRIVLGVVIATAGSLFCSASFNFVIHPIVAGLQASETQSAMLRQLPGMGGLLAIFVAGVLVLRIGPQRCLVGSAVLMILGFLITCLAPTMGVLTIGLLAAYVGKSAVVVVALSLLSTSIRSSEGRASAFATFAMVSPAVCVVVPILAAYVVDAFGWRWVAVIWMLGGILVLVATVTLLSGVPSLVTGKGELITPMLAGIVLVGLTQVVRLIATDGWLATSVWVASVITLIALGALIITAHRMSQPSMSLSVLRNGVLAMLLVVVLLMPFSNLWFYGTIGAQYIYGLTALEVSLIFIPIQLAGVFGAKLAGSLVKVRGITFAGTVTLIGAAAMSFLCVTQSTTLPIIVPLVILMIYGACGNGTAGTVTNSIMTMAPEKESGEASAYRSAASSLGSSLGAVFMSTIVFSTMAISIADQSATAGINPQQAEQIANDMREGATSEEVSSQYSTPVSSVDQIQEFQREAAVEGYRAQGVGSGTMLLIAAGIFYFTRRRIDRREAEQPSADQSAG